MHFTMICNEFHNLELSIIFILIESLISVHVYALDLCSLVQTGQVGFKVTTFELLKSPKTLEL